MTLDYIPHIKQQAPVAEEETKTYDYYTPKESDKYSMFINMQNTVNAALQKSAAEQKPRANDPTELGSAQAGIRYDV